MLHPVGLAGILSACGAEAPFRPDAEVRDAAGIAIVDNALDSIALAVWRVPDSAVVDIGGEEAGPGMLQRVRRAIRDPSGNIVVGDGATSELRRFDSTGRIIGAWGRLGDGPGEFRGTGPFWPVPPDSLHVYDHALRRVTTLASRLTRLALPPREVSAADHEAYLTQELEAIAEFNRGAPEALRAQWRAALRERRGATHFPLIDDVIVADDGSLWVEVFRWRRDAPRRYLIFDPGGRLRGRAATPPRARPTMVRGDRVLALWRDEDDIEHVRVYPVHR